MDNLLRIITTFLVQLWFIMSKKLSSFCLLFLGHLFLSGCAGEGVEADPQPRDYSNIFSPIPTSTIYPKSNIFNAEKEALGELLFWDPVLSGDQNVACASCHHPNFAWADGRALSVGSDGIGLGPARQGLRTTPFHSPSVLNVAFTGFTQSSNINEFVSGRYFWDLRAQTLEEQALEPIKNEVEMLGSNIDKSQIMTEIIMRLQGIPEYVDRFEQAFETDDAISEQNIAKALATFQRKLITPSTRFDQFLRGDTSVLNQQEIIGLNKFIDGGCARCHSGPMLSDYNLDNNNIVIDQLAVRTPNLRNLSITGPYMHNGRIISLRDAIAEYEDRDDLDVTIGDGDFQDIEVFLRVLDNNNFYKQIPQQVPSGLTVGGDIQ